MVKIIYGTDSYYYSNGNWYGHNRSRNHSDLSRHYPGNNTRAPLGIFPELRKAALSQGVDPALLARPKSDDLEDEITEEKPKSRKSRRAKKKNSVFIF